jgi:hypothetical protein
MPIARRIIFFATTRKNDSPIKLDLNVELSQRQTIVIQHAKSRNSLTLKPK